jgi:POT family proton-dependent oligopeptide transporter
MQTHGIPNDVFQNLSALTVIIAMPLVQNGLYPLLRRLHIRHPPIYRIAVGFLLQAGAMAYAAGVQQMIYNTGPCYDQPNRCLISQSSPGPNHINVAIQIPAYVLDGLAGVFYYPTGQQYAYTKAPVSMKSLVQSILMATVGLGAALAFALSPAYKDPTNTIMFAAVGGFMFLTTCIFCLLLRKYNEIEDDAKKESLE